MMNPSPIDWTPCHEVSKALRDSVEAILQQWAEHVTDRLPDADRLTHSQLRDHLPKVLDALARALDQEGADPIQAIAKMAEEHGTERCHESYSVNELLIEFGMLRPIMLDHLATALGRPLSLDELIPINDGLDAAMRYSVDRFVADQSRQIQAVNETHAKYLAYMSHDLRGGLNGIMLMTELLSRTLGNDEAFRESVADLASMKNSIQETIYSMEMFLQGERLRRGSVTPAPVRSNLGDVLRRAVNSFSSRAAGRQVRLQLEIEDAVTSEVDRDLLSFILSQLLSNAIRHSPTNEVVRVVLRLIDDNKFARISVVDRGPGIAPPRQAGLFRASASSDALSAAAGLVSAGHAADLIHATLSVDSQLNAGAAFHLMLGISPSPDDRKTA